METPNDQKIPLPPLALGNEPHHDYSQFFDEAEFPAHQRRILKRRQDKSSNPPGMDQVLGFFTGKVARRDASGTGSGKWAYSWDAAPLLLVGKPGAAKTTMACDIADRVARLGFKVFYSDAHEMLRRYEHKALDIDEYEGQFLTTRALVIDNFENLLAGQEGSLMSWVKRRSDEGRWTIVVADMLWDPAPGAKNTYPVSASVIDYFNRKGQTLFFN